MVGLLPGSAPGQGDGRRWQLLNVQKAVASIVVLSRQRSSTGTFEPIPYKLDPGQAELRQGAPGSRAVIHRCGEPPGALFPPIATNSPGRRLALGKYDKPPVDARPHDPLGRPRGEPRSTRAPIEGRHGSRLRLGASCVVAQSALRQPALPAASRTMTVQRPDRPRPI